MIVYPQWGSQLLKSWEPLVQGIRQESRLEFSKNLSTIILKIPQDIRHKYT